MNLKDMLTDSLVVPFEDEIINRLGHVCQSYSDQLDASEIVSRLTISVLMNEPDLDVKKVLEEIYQSEYKTAIHLPKCVMRPLAVYIVHRMLTNQGEIWPYLAVRNCLVLCAGEYDRVPYPEFFIYVVDYTNTMLKTMSKLDKTDDSAFMKALFNNEYKTLDLSEKESQNMMKNIVREAWYYRTQKTLKDLLEMDNQYARIYKMLDSLVDTMPWELHNEQSLLHIRLITPYAKPSKITIRQIIEKASEVIDDFETLNDSSILLRVMSDDQDELRSSVFMDKQLSAREFALYLYYELLLEKHYG